MDNEQKGFILFNDWRPFFDFLDEVDAGVLIKALFDFACDGKVANADDLTPECAGQYYFMIGVISDNRRKWEETRIKRSEAGKIGGLASASKRQANVKQNQANVKQTPSTDQADLSKSNHNVNVNVNDNVNVNVSTNVDKNSSHKTNGRFVPPTLDELKSYINEKGYTVDAESFFNFYESKGWYVGKNKMTKWKAAVANWQRKEKGKEQSMFDVIANFGGDELGEY